MHVSLYQCTHNHSYVIHSLCDRRKLKIEANKQLFIKIQLSSGSRVFDTITETDMDFLLQAARYPGLSRSRIDDVQVEVWIGNKGGKGWLLSLNNLDLKLL